jgi:DNA-binding transcriptional MerR regulator
MAYTVTKLAKLSGVSVRTLHWYDEVGLLKPAYYGSNGYRYYEEKQVLMLQQILFFKELGFELKQIQKIVGRADFDKIVALSSHRTVLQKNLERTQKLIKTIDKTIEHLKGKISMKEEQMFFGFSQEKQAEFEKELIGRFGEKVKNAVAESRQKVKGWTKGDWDASQKEFDEICKSLMKAVVDGQTVDSEQVKIVIRRHFAWIKQFWTPTKESYSGHGRFIVESDLRKAYEHYDQNLPEFISEAIQVFADGEFTE